MTTASPLELRFRRAREEPDDSNMPSMICMVEPIDFLDEMPFDFKYLQKFKSTLTPGQMETDIEFCPDSDGKDYREHIQRW